MKIIIEETIPCGESNFYSVDGDLEMVQSKVLEAEKRGLIDPIIENISGHSIYFHGPYSSFKVYKLEDFWKNYLPLSK